MAGLAGVLSAPPTQAAGIDWNSVPGKEVALFYPGQSSWERSLTPDDMSGATSSGSQITRSTINLQPLPDVTSMLHMIQLRGEYSLRPNMTLIFGYAFGRFNYKDFLNGQSPTAYASVVVPGFNNNNESIHIVGAGMRIRF